MTRREIVVLHEARIDLTDCAVYISANSEAAAIRFLDAFDAAIVDIGARSLSGQVVQAAGRQLHGCRSWPLPRFKNWRIFYRIEGDRIEVVRLLHATRDLTNLD